MKPEIPVPVVILAGGQGRRIGGDKVLHVLAGETLLARALQNASLYSAHIAIAASRKNAEDFPPGADLLVDEADDKGPITALASALDYAASRGAAHVLIIPCDAPFLPPDLIHRLYHAIGKAHASIACSGGHIHAACSLWRADVREMLSAYITQGRGSLVGFAEMVGYATAAWPVLSVDPFFNINTKADLATAEQALKRMPVPD